MEEVIRYRKQDLLDYAIKFMGKLGVPKQDAKIVGDVLIAADLRGVNSHGLIRLSSYYGNRLLKKYMDPKTPWKVVKETDTTMLIDGGNGVGQVVSYHAMNKCLEKADKKAGRDWPAVSLIALNITNLVPSGQSCFRKK